MRTRLFVSASLISLLVVGCTKGGTHFSSAGSSRATPGASRPATGGSALSASIKAEIVAPQNAAQVSPGVAVSLEGRAVDSSTGAVVSATLAWSSSIDGPLGSGSPLLVASLTPGIHKIVLQASSAAASSGGGSAQDSRLLVVAGTNLTGQPLLKYLASLPNHLLGSPIGFPPSVPALLAANPTDVNGITGNGGLTAGFSESGVLTVFRWPSPSYWNQVNYVAEPGHAPGFGTTDSMGAFQGLALRLAGGGQVVTWLRDATWKRSQRYRTDDSAVLVTEYKCDTLGLRVVAESFAHPTEDVLVQHFSLERLPASPVLDGATFLYYENLTPCTTKLPYVPYFDVFFDILNDFACGYSTREDALVHFRPKNADFGALTAFAAAPHASLAADVDAFLDGAGTRFGPGVYFAIGGDQPSTGYQCGLDMGGAGSTNPAPSGRDAYADASTGTLSKSPIALVRANAALSRDIDLSKGKVELTWYVAAGELPDGQDGARERLKRARSLGYADHLSAVEADWSKWIGRARLPKPPADARTVAFAKRSLIVARQSTDRSTGAIVASICTQAPYAEDWPRDGAFINYALDVAGYPEMVEKHNEFYARVQRKGWFFPGTWEMNYYADGMPGGPVPLEIDETAFAIWTMADHAQFEPDPVKRSAYLGKVYPAIKLATDFLVGWRDPVTGLQLPANEDDNIVPTRGLHGAIAILRGLDSAIEAGVAVGESPSVLATWRARRDELAKAIDAHFWDASLATFREMGTGGNPLGPPTQPTAWLVWPATFLPLADPRVQSSCDWLWSHLDKVIQKQVKDSAYDPKTTLSLAFAWRNDPSKLAKLRKAFETFTHELPTEGTLHVGEFYKVDPSGRWRSVNDTPHVWEHMLIYHSAMELYR